MGFALGFIYIIVTGAVLLSMAILYFQGESTKSNRIFLFCQGMVVLWCISQTLQIMAATMLQLTVSYLIGNIGICFIGCIWLHFALIYSGFKYPKWIPITTYSLSGIQYGLILTNHYHHLYYRSFTLTTIEHGPLFYVTVILTYLCVFFGSCILYIHLKKEKEKARLFVIASVLIPIFLNALYLLGLIKATFDVTPLGFAISVVLMMLATCKYQFINLRRELTITNEKLILERERNRIAQQVHDTAGHTLTMIQSYLKLAEIAEKDQKSNEVTEYLQEARILTGNGIRELRESINMLRQASEYELITQGVMQLAKQVKEIPVNVTVKGEDSKRYSHLSPIIYDTVRESITNTLKYANASQMDIVIRFQPNVVELLIADDGAGCQKIVDNNGLKGIRNRIEQANGQVRFTTSEGEGFLTRASLPL